MRLQFGNYTVSKKMEYHLAIIMLRSTLEYQPITWSNYKSNNSFFETPGLSLQLCAVLLWGPISRWEIFLHFGNLCNEVATGAKGAMPPQFLAYLVVLRFERRCPKPNTVARLKSKYLAFPKILG